MAQHRRERQRFHQAVVVPARQVVLWALVGLDVIAIAGFAGLQAQGFAAGVGAAPFVVATPFVGCFARAGAGLGCCCGFGGKEAALHGVIRHQHQLFFAGGHGSRAGVGIVGSAALAFQTGGMTVHAKDY